MSFHVPVILLALCPPIFGWGDFLLPIHIVLLEMVVHPVSAFAFENLVSTSNKREKQLLPMRQFLLAMMSGLLLSAGTLAIFRYNLGGAGLDTARSVSLVSILFGNIFFVLAECWPLLTRRLVIIFLSLVMLACILVWEPHAAKLFHLVSIGWAEMFLALGVGAIASFPSFILRTRR